MIEGASIEEVERLHEAVDRFTDAGFALPDLRVLVSEDENRCLGAKGLFTTNTEPWLITLCTDDLGVVVEHELAHAWERATVSDDLRDVFMRHGGYSVWRSHDVPWRERAVEGLAMVIQQGVSGLDLPPTIGVDAKKRLEAFELLTGRPDPRLVEWLGAFDVSCSERPTDHSRTIPDSTGRVCTQ